MQCVPSTYHNYLKYIQDGVVHYVLGDENPYSHCNHTHISGEIALPSTHYFTLPMVLEKVSIAYIDKEGASLSYLKGKDLIDLEKPRAPNINMD